ncbi:DUF1871 family protein [Bacillus dakarensis]|uniref:DUF1871 family protein n=1 Tax=Robertmurraya dakarensis TaxID=1926278 RepID=UPI00098107A1|nr:DUF1871 family protein [Bacillus dakarensis]
MEMLNTNLKLVKLLKEWDPLGYGEEAYDSEIADTLQAVHMLNDRDKLARKIQAIYEFSFEEIIPLVKCKQISVEMLAIKNEDSCSI